MTNIPLGVKFENTRGRFYCVDKLKCAFCRGGEMPRQPRQKSESGIYHIMLRGINQQVIFEEDEDYDKFLEILEKYKRL